MRHRFLAGTTAVALICGVWAASAVAGPATYYASPTSSDTTGSCSSSAPCRLDHALSLASAGDVVVVLPGTYSVTYPLSADLPITLEGEPGEPRPSLVGSPSLTSDTLEVSSGAVVRHLEIETQNNTGARTTALSIDGGTAEDLVLVTGPSDSQGEALSIKDSAAGTTVRTVLARTQAPDSEAVSFKDSKTAPGSVSVYSLTAIGEAPTATAISANVATGTVWVKDSIAYGAGGDVSTKPGTQPINLTYSDFRPGESSGYVDQGGNALVVPAFVNAAGEDFHEAQTSPTIDAGANDPALTATDLDGNPRVLGAAPDMGAYEYQGALGGGSPSGGTTGGDDPSVLAPASSPVPGVSVSVRRISGAVLVRLPGNRRFLRLRRASSIPLGSVIDVTTGDAFLTSAVDRAGHTKTGRFTSGRFVVTQPTGARLVTSLRLVGGSFAGCQSFGAAPGGSTPGATIARRRPRHRVVRQLWGSDSGGSFVTIGDSASAAVRGTVWLTQDRCDGTLVRVVRGRVLVHDDALGRNVLIGAGHSYLARARF